MSNDCYSFGECLMCKKNTALKNGYCNCCEPKILEGDSAIKFFTDLFNKGE